MGPGHGAQETRGQRWLALRSAGGCRTHGPAPPSARLPWSPQQQRPEPCRALSRDRQRGFQVPQSPHVTPGAGRGVIHPPGGREGHCPPSDSGTKGHGERPRSAAKRRSPRSPASAVPPSRWCPLRSGQRCSSRSPPSHHRAACLVPCLTGTVTPLRPDCQQNPRQADPRNILTVYYRCFQPPVGGQGPDPDPGASPPGPETAPPNTQFHLEIF